MKKIAEQKNFELTVGLTQYFLILVTFLIFSPSIRQSGVWETLFLMIGLLLVLTVVVVGKILKIRVSSFFQINPRARQKVKIWTIATISFFFLFWLIVIRFDAASRYFPSGVWSLDSVRLMLLINWLVVPMTIFCQEFFFRGFLLWMIRRKFANFQAVLLQAGLFALFVAVSASGPIVWTRVLTFFILGNILGWIAIKGRSYLLSGLVYWVYLFLVDIYVLYRLASLS